MSSGFVPWLLAAVLLPLVVAEFKDWWPRLAVGLVRWSARRLGDPHACARYEEEWVANLQEVPGKLSPLLAAFGYVAVVPRMRWAIRRGPVPLNVRPEQLPKDMIDFVGREHELAELDTLLFVRRSDRSAKRGPWVILLAGVAGVGKTALALRWAHRNRDKFSDGHLYASLRGYGPGEPLGQYEVLGRFLHSLGVRAAHIPASLEERSAVYRSLTARRQLLVVLDNVASVEQVQSLLPDGPKSVAVITSRSMLPAVVQGGAHRLAIGTFDVEASVALMRTVLGSDRVDAEFQSVMQLIELCAYLPLALRIAGANASSQPRSAVGELVERVQSSLDRFPSEQDLIDAEQYGVRAVFDLSYRALSAEAARLFRRIGALPERRFSCADAISLGGSAAEGTIHLLAVLVKANLLEATGDRGMFAVHPLLRIYAQNCLAAEEPDYVYPMVG
ncbi:NB-ARC domain-containing protein (plasmid) [Lentzea sp. JNUCC 0626]|uniref:NB-ARC domain-containing protein n=1 Tax=Lentzea sp. JNUCC 0626 TaxID=3367513 RepID=UPI0037487087